ncbi:MAG: redox-regulated ATPase YchF [Candidatus Diapherotrites archaeon]|nr:redox-regulated ATPase YchF [Candidatus Diapherotrites archaeon]
MLVGVVGKPSTGKSTFFKALTMADVEINPRPFTTIKPNRGVGYVRIECVENEFKVKCNPRQGTCLNGTRFVPIDMLDVAGLIEGAHEGKGLGNSFLDDLRQADALVHIVDCSGSTNEKGERCAPLTHDPAIDIKMLENEMNQWMAQIIGKNFQKFSKRVATEKKQMYKELALQLSGLKISEEQVKAALDKLKLMDLSALSWTEKEFLELAIELRKASKPMLIAANKIDIPGADKNLERLKQEFPDYLFVPCSAEAELALKEAGKKGLIEYIPGSNNFKILNESLLSEQQKQGLLFLQKNVLDKYGSTGVQEVLDAGVFKLLEMIAVFPGGLNNLTDSKGRVLPDCYLMPKNSTALDFAFKIHTDFGNNFIRAVNVKKRMVIGRDYTLQNRDVIEIISGK